MVCCEPPRERGLLDAIVGAGIEMIYLPRPRRSVDVSAVRRVYGLCRRLRCDVIRCHNLHASPMIGAAAAGVPVRLWFKRSMQPAFEACRQERLRDRLAISVRMTCCLATRVLPVSSAVKEELVRLGVPASKLIVLNNPSDRALSTGRGRARARASFGYDEKALVFTTVGHAVPVKGWDILIRAFAVVAAEVPQARLLFVGSFDGERERDCHRELRSLTQSCGLNGRVRFAGQLDDPKIALGASDVFVMPSRSEGYSNALIEAMHAGLATVSAGVGIAPEVIRHGENGLLVARGDHRELAKALMVLARSPETRKRISSEVQKRTYAPTFEEYADRLFELSRSLLAQRR